MGNHRFFSLQALPKTRDRQIDSFTSGHFGPGDLSFDKPKLAASMARGSVSTAIQRLPT